MAKTSIDALKLAQIIVDELNARLINRFSGVGIAPLETENPDAPNWDVVKFMPGLHPAEKGNADVVIAALQKRYSLDPEA